MCLFKYITGLVSENPLAVNVLKTAQTFYKELYEKDQINKLKPEFLKQHQKKLT